MILEYLFLDNTHKDKLENYSYHYDVKNNGEITRTIDATVKIHNFENSDHWIIKIEIDGASEEVAKHLSKINDDIISYHPIVLKNESSAYFNKQLYPYVNSFERELRRFLYLKSNLSSNKKAKQVIENLEKLTFEKIYIRLFVDNDFCKAVHSYSEKPIFSRSELIDKINQFNEKTVWDTIVEPNVLSLIKEDFLKLKDYRNDVMHAHNISYEQYKEIKKLYTKVNIQLLAQIEMLLNFDEQSEMSDMFVETLYEKLETAHDNFSKIEEMVKKFAATSEKISSIEINPNIIKFVNFLLQSSEKEDEPDE